MKTSSKTTLREPGAACAPGGTAARVVPAYRFSGHETFPLRYSWLPKAFAALCSRPNLFADEDLAMVELGVGKNMVRAIRFWVQAAGVAIVSEAGSMSPTVFGRDILAEKGGHDPYLEDSRTLWLIHWKLSANIDEPLFAWEYLLSRFPHPEFTATSALDAFTKESIKLERTLSAATLGQHFEVFLHTYIPTRSRKGEVREDNLDSPLVELDLIRRIGERRGEVGDRIEVLYAFNREPKPTITPELFVYCLSDYWAGKHQNEDTISFRDVALGIGSPGQVFKLNESDLRDRLQTLREDSRGAFAYRESSALAQVIKTGEPTDLLANIYCEQEMHA